MHRELTHPTPTKGSGETLIARRSCRVYRLLLAQGGTLPLHRSDDDVVVVVLRGSGLFHIDSLPTAVSAGDVIDLPAGAWHAIDAVELLELVIVHATNHELASQLASH